MAAEEDSSIIKLPTLGRPLQLAMLYDCRNDSLIPGVTLWDMETIQQDVRVTLQPKTEFKIISADSIEEKAYALNLSTSLKASFLGGMIEVGGAAKYLKEMKSSKRQVRVTLQYSATTRFEELTMKHLGPQNISYPGIYDQNMATHVVTAVLYGAQAFFMFDEEVSSSESIQDVHVELHAAVKKIPMFDLEEEGTGALKENSKCNFERLSCTFCGDFGLKNNPSTYEEAIIVYKSLPSLLGTNGENAIPLKVWLFPLRKLDSRASGVIHIISSVLIENVQDAMEELSDVDMECNDMLAQPAALNFTAIKSRIQKLKHLCKQYRMAFQADLARIIPAVRGGEADSRALMTLLNAKDKSPFSTTQLSEFVESKQNEVGFVSSYIKLLTENKGVHVVASQVEINQVLRDPKVQIVISFTFTSLKEDEPYLSDLNSWLHLNYMTETSSPNSARPDLGQKKLISWFSDVDVIQKSRVYMNEFTEFGRANARNNKITFIVSSVSDTNNPGTSIYLYDQGVLKSTAFHPPSPDIPEISQISHDSVQLTCASGPAGSDLILTHKAEYRSMDEDSWSCMEGYEASNVLTVTGLRPNILYQFRQSTVTARWVTLPSDPTHIVKMLPCSPPENVTGQHEGLRAIHLTWQEPGNIGAGARIRDYKVEFKEDSKDSNTWMEKLTGKKAEKCTIQGLNQNSTYRFRVSANCGTAGSSAPSEEYVISTEDGMWRTPHFCTLC
ncbi:verrucotoxin subunit beta-like [Pleurodeles waltl]|uniref:verrucotoxin subunit beta-like n=1 Tax=Pleurodeles waltl TaxID=8319 RepID=UPI003709BC3A